MDELTEKEAMELRSVLKQFFDESFVDDLRITPSSYAIASELFDATEKCTSAISRLPMPSAFFSPQMFFSAYAREQLIRKFKSRKSPRFMVICMTTQKAKWRSALVIASVDGD